LHQLQKVAPQLSDLKSHSIGYIENPLIDIDEINKRYNIVETLLDEFILKEDLKNLLYEVYDLERLSGRIAFGNANGRDLLQLKNSLKVLPDIKNILNAIKFKDIDTFKKEIIDEFKELESSHYFTKWCDKTYI
jgi:DNA mismatch repair ATPase MutS